MESKSIMHKVKEAWRGIRYSLGRNPLDSEMAAVVVVSVANVSLYSEIGIGTARQMVQSHIKGLLEESDELFLSMEKNGCAANSRILNAIVRKLFEKGDVRRAGTYLTKIDEKEFSVEASTAALLVSIVSEKKYQKEVKFLPEKYQSFMEPRDD